MAFPLKLHHEDRRRGGVCSFLIVRHTAIRTDMCARESTYPIFPVSPKARRENSSEIVKKRARVKVTLFLFPFFLSFIGDRSLGFSFLFNVCVVAR